MCLEEDLLKTGHMIPKPRAFFKTQSEGSMKENPKLTWDTTAFGGKEGRQPARQGEGEKVGPLVPVHCCRTQTFLAIVSRNWSIWYRSRWCEHQGCTSPKNSLPLRLLIDTNAFKTANSTNGQKKSPHFQLMRQVCCQQQHTISCAIWVFSPFLSSSQDWPLDYLQFQGNFPLRQLSTKGRFLKHMCTERVSTLLLHFFKKFVKHCIFELF